MVFRSTPEQPATRARSRTVEADETGGRLTADTGVDATTSEEKPARRGRASKTDEQAAVPEAARPLRQSRRAAAAETKQKRGKRQAK